MISYIMQLLFGTTADRRIRNYSKLVNLINKKSKSLMGKSEASFKAFISGVKNSLQGKQIEDVSEEDLVNVFALVKSSCVRIIGKEYLVMGHINSWHMVPYDVQMLAGIALYNGNISEQATGEGKTLAAVLPLCLYAMTGHTVFLVTINEYLAQRDAEWMAPIYEMMDLSVGVVKSSQTFAEKQKVYKCDVVYTTSSELVFDYLRDHSIVYSAEDRCLPYLSYVVIDEVDAVLIMDARMPLIISGPSEPAPPEYKELNPFVEQVVQKQKEICDVLLENVESLLLEQDLLEDRTSQQDVNKLSQPDIIEAIRNLWIASKGWPDHYKVKYMMEFPWIRSLVEREERYFSYEQNHDERISTLSKLILVHNFITKMFEFTDYGIQVWESIAPEHTSDFVMLDIGHAMSEVDEREDLSTEEKLEQKVLIQQEAADRRNRAMCIKQLFYAHIVTKRDESYIVENGEVVLLDTVGGRLQYGRRFSHGLHQAIEAKEGVEVKTDTKTYATITLQNFFKMFAKISGMSGTAMVHAVEFKQIYGADVVAIPTNLPSQRVDYPDVIFVTNREKMASCIKSLRDIHSSGRPVLLGTISVEDSEFLSKRLTDEGIPHQLLNAKNHRREAEIISMAGQRGSVTIATNMAGRGTDIKLGVGVADIGGLHVLVSSRSTNRSIDMQFRGRQGRQGDPGSCQFFVSFEDELLRSFTTSAVKSLLDMSRPPEGEGMESPVLESAIANAQERFEFMRYQMRKNTFNYDEVVNTQRNEVYRFRDEVLCSHSIIELVDQLLHEYAVDFVKGYVESVVSIKQIDFNTYREDLLKIFPIVIHEKFFNKHYHNVELLEEDTEDILVGEFWKMFNNLNTVYKKSAHKVMMNPGEALRSVFLHSLDMSWRDMLEHLEELRSHVNLRAIGQKDPLIEYRHEAYKMFEAWGINMRKVLAIDAFRFTVAQDKSVTDQAQINKRPESKLFYSFNNMK